jgi:riboflavin synthase alpha subunit
LQSGHRVNLEFDMIGKYVLKIQENRTSNALTRDKLIESGW